MLEIELSSEEKFSINSKKIPLTPSKKYMVSTQTQCVKGEQFSGYLGIVFLNDEGVEIDRKIKWINQKSNELQPLKIIFKSNTNNILYIYRINEETPRKSECNLRLSPFKDIKIAEIDDYALEDFDNIFEVPLDRKPELSPEQEDKLEKNLVWICTSARSGSTWLARQLLSYQTKYLHEPSLADHLSIIAGFHDDRAIRKIDATKNVGSYFFSNMFKKTWQYYLRKMILNRIYAEVNNIDSKIIIKESSEVDASDIISECLPNSKFIILLRDGRDILDSDIDGRQKGGWMVKQSGLKTINKFNRMNYIKNRAKRWASLTENLIQTSTKHNKNLVSSIKYENLRSNTLEELKKIYKFLEIEIPDDALYEIVDKSSFEKIPKEQKGTGKFARSATPGKWKEHFSEEEQKIMTEIMGDTLQKLGY